MIETEMCLVCKRNVFSQHMTTHHWHPVSLGGNDQNVMRMCVTCHSLLHKVIPLDEVINYKTPESLDGNWLYKKYLDFIRTKSHAHPYKIKKLINSIYPRFVIKHYIDKFNKRNPKIPESAVIARL